MNRIFLKPLLAAVLLFSVGTASAATAIGEDWVRDVYYWFYDDGHAVVESDSYSGPDYSGRVVIPATVTYNGTTYNVTEIGEYVFRDCPVTEVILPEGLKKIGEVAFSGGDFASLTIPNSVITMGEGCFGGCDKLVSLTIGSGLTEIPARCFSRAAISSVTLPDNITSLGEEAFVDCASLEEVTLGKGLKQISDRCFQNSGLKSISLPSRLSSIGVEAFSDCASLTTADLGTGLREIPEKCFQNSGLVTITLPESVTTVGEWAFAGCVSLRSLTVCGPKTFDESAFNIYKTTTDYINVYIDDLADWCERSTFANQYSCPFVAGGNEGKLSSLYLNGELVENLVIPDGVVRVSDYSFYNCGSIKTVVVPDGVMAIGKYAFYCPEMTKVTLGNTVSIIGSSAFYSGNLTEFICYNPVPPANSGLNYYEDFTVYVPVGSVDAYKNSEAWRYFNIKPIGEGGVEEIGSEGVSVSVVDGRIVVSGADDDDVVEVYDLSGRRVYAGVAAEIPLTDGGVYVVKVAGQAFKMAI